MRILKILLILFLIYIIFGGTSVFEINTGKDTIVYLGNGDYQIMKGVYTDSEDELKRTYSLVDVSVIGGEYIIFHVFKYNHSRINTSIYVIGKDKLSDKDFKYVVLNYKTGEMVTFNNYEGLDEKNKIIFDTKKFKNLSNYNE